MAHPRPYAPPYDGQRSLRLRLARRAGAVVGLLVLALSGCSDDGSDDAEPPTVARASDAPADAATDAFCRLFDDAPSGDDMTADQLHDYADGLRETGTPVGFDPAARLGFELFVDFLTDLDDDELGQYDDADEPSDVFSGDQATEVEAFVAEVGDTCVPRDGATATPS